jgi:hypothetical protein
MRSIAATNAPAGTEQSLLSTLGLFLLLTAATALAAFAGSLYLVILVDW